MTIHDTPGALAADLNKIAAAFKLDVNTVYRKIAFDLHRKIVMRTPIDTGRAAASWGMAEGEPKDYVQPEGAYADPLGASFRLVSVEPGSHMPVIWIFNNLPYIETLEYGGYPGDGPKTVGGFSSQAPAGMVRISIAEVETEIAEALGVLR